VERPRAPQRDRRRAADQQPLPPGEPQRREQREHQGQVGEREEEDQRHDQPSAQVGEFSARVAAARGCDVSAVRATTLSGGIAGLRDGLGEYPHGQASRGADQGGPCRVVHRGMHAV